MSRHICAKPLNKPVARYTKALENLRRVGQMAPGRRQTGSSKGVSKHRHAAETTQHIHNAEGEAVRPFCIAPHSAEREAARAAFPRGNGDWRWHGHRQRVPEKWDLLRVQCRHAKKRRTAKTCGTKCSGFMGHLNPATQRDKRRDGSRGQAGRCFTDRPHLPKGLPCP
uniref:Uncharacterized protein n=1 Tax=Eutreptiella gymnastica TaxID=73025 RepID=A0A7S4LMI1_9EUGL